MYVDDESEVIDDVCGDDKGGMMRGGGGDDVEDLFNNVPNTDQSPDSIRSQSMEL